MPDNSVRVGWGLDAHRFGGEPPVLLGGVAVDAEQGVVATSDGDVAAHAIADALLGACAMGDLGHHFPSSDPRWQGADSLDLLRRSRALCPEFVIDHVDLTVIAETVRIAPHRAAIQSGLAAALGVEPDRVSVKATTTDGMGFAGRGEGIAAMAVVTGRSGR